MALIKADRFPAQLDIRDIGRHSIVRFRECCAVASIVLRRSDALSAAAEAQLAG